MDYNEHLVNAGREEAMLLGTIWGIGHSIMKAISATMRMAESEARITARSAAEMHYVRYLIEKYLRSANAFDSSRSSLTQVELNNGSCILLKNEDSHVRFR